MPAKNQNNKSVKNPNPPVEQVRTERISMSDIVNMYLERYVLVDAMTTAMEQLEQVNVSPTIMARLRAAQQIIESGLPDLSRLGIDIPVPSMGEELPEMPEEEPEEPQDLSTPIGEEE